MNVISVPFPDFTKEHVMCPASYGQRSPRPCGNGGQGAKWARPTSHWHLLHPPRVLRASFPNQETSVKKLNSQASKNDG